MQIYYSGSISSLCVMRNFDTNMTKFRNICHELSYDLCTNCKSHIQEQSTVVLMPILRSGLFMLPAAISTFPNASIGILGLQRNKQKHCIDTYFYKSPNINKKTVIILDPMIASGDTMFTALKYILQDYPSEIFILSLICTPKGINKIDAIKCNIKLFTVAIDNEIDSNGYIVPGLGDFGDRAFGTN